ncbi:MAG: class I SAM-dependent methyltransferase [Candidatus Moranbacteria bacterium]|nr:class I SAM-dependent methyltransferase [Candidatus Moranbacteria bacterium]
MNTGLLRRYNKIASAWNGDAYATLRRDDMLPAIIEAVSISSLPQQTKVLEAMCGTAKVGIALKEAIEKSGKHCNLSLLDFSQAMLDQAAVAAEKICADACEILLDSESFDLVLTRFGIHDIEQTKQLMAIREVLRVLTKDGRYVLVAFCSSAKTQFYYNRIANLKDELAGNKDSTDRYFPTEEEYLNLLRDAGFSSIGIKNHFFSRIKLQATGEMPEEKSKLWADFVSKIPSKIKKKMHIQKQANGSFEYDFPVAIFVAEK